MQRVRLWEVNSNQQLDEVPNSQIDLEERLENWLENDISVLDPGLLVIGRQVRTDFGGLIDLLCLDSAGDTVVIELKKGLTPRDVTAQALDYASWVKDLSSERLTDIATTKFGDQDSLAEAFSERFGAQFPDQLNLSHRLLIVAEAMDSSTERIVRYLSGFDVPINVATVQHFKNIDGREILAQVYLIEPEDAEARSRSRSKRTSYTSLTQLQDVANESGIGPLYSRIREGVRGILSAQSYSRDYVAYTAKKSDGGAQTVLLIWVKPHEISGGLPFVAHATRFHHLLGVGHEDLMDWLPENTEESEVRNWVGSSQEERQDARGFEGSFQSEDEVNTFLDGLKQSGPRG